MASHCDITILPQYPQESCETVETRVRSCPNVHSSSFTSSGILPACRSQWLYQRLAQAHEQPRHAPFGPTSI